MRDGVADQLVRGGLSEVTAKCVANGVTDALSLADTNDDDIEMSKRNIDRMLTFGVTCELARSVDPCVIEALAAIADRGRLERPIDALAPFDREAITGRDIEHAQRRC